MAVHTPLEVTEIAAFLEEAGLAGDPLEAAAGVAEGSIHTTYRLVHGGRTRYLRRYEGTSPETVAYELALLAHLEPSTAGFGLCLPRVVPLGDGALFAPLAGAPAALFEEVPGEPRPPGELAIGEIASLGRVIGLLHRTSAGFGLRRANPYGPATVEAWLDQLQTEAEAEAETATEIAEALPRLRRALESGRRAFVGGEAVVGHGDLFADNLHWSGEEISGVLDFEMACDLPPGWDLAVGLLVFCWGEEGPDLERSTALLGGYRVHAGATPVAAGRLQAIVSFVAARYALSRIRDFARSDLPSDRLVQKDWRDFDRRLRDLEQRPGEFWRELLAR